MIDIKKVISILLVLCTLLSAIPYSAFALSWDGDSAGGSTNAVNGSSTGYVIRSTSDSACVVGYRFSAVNSSGGMKVTKVIDVYRNTSNGDNAYSTSAKFSTKYNKKQIIANVQQKLIAIHHTDCPWRPADLQQREGRIVRQGNENPEVEIYSYVTEQTFDAYLYQLVENKQKFIGQIMTSKSPVRSAEDVDEQALSYAEIKALATGNPYIKEKMDLDVAVSKLKLLKQNHLSQRYSLEDRIIKFYPQQIKQGEERIAGYYADIERAKENTFLNEDNFSPMIVEDITYDEKKGAGSAILVACKAMTSPDPKQIGSYRGFNMELSFNSFEKEYVLTLVGSLRHSVSLGADIYGNITRLDNLISSLPDKLKACEERLADTKVQLENAKAEVERPFPQEEELSQKMERLAELNALLDMDHHDNEIVDGEVEQEERDKSVRDKSVER